MEDGQHGRGAHRSIGLQEYLLCPASFFRLDPRAVYLISDGGDNLSRSHLNDVRKALAAAQVRLHVTLLAQDGPISPSESLGAADVRELAYESGGLVMGSLGLATSGSVRYDLAEVKRRAVASQLSLM